MSANGCAEWSSHAYEFFKSAEDGSIILNIMTPNVGEGSWEETFEDLISLINLKADKIKKIIIINKLCLHSRTIPTLKLSRCYDKASKTKLTSMSLDMTSRIKCDFEIKSWSELLSQDDFEEWYLRIKNDFSDGRSDLCRKLFDDVSKNVDHNSILNECARVCGTFQNKNVVCQQDLAGALIAAAKYYGLCINFLNYYYYVSDISHLENGKIVDIVLIDDNVSFTDALHLFLGKHGLSVNVYNNGYDFLDNMHMYHKDTKIISDYDLKQEINGFDLLRKSYELGFRKLYILSGNRFESLDIPYYLRFVEKDAEGIENFLKQIMD
jgi:CheY-like chemotaxis protein